MGYMFIGFRNKIMDFSKIIFLVLYYKINI